MGRSAADDLERITAGRGSTDAGETIERRHHGKKQRPPALPANPRKATLRCPPAHLFRVITPPHCQRCAVSFWIRSCKGTSLIMTNDAPVWYEPADPTPRHQCPCCDYISLPERGNYLICRICFWEDDGRTSTSWTRSLARTMASRYGRGGRTSVSLELSSVKCYETLFRQDSVLNMSIDPESWPEHALHINMTRFGISHACPI